MPFHRLLIANRGEIAIRIARAAGDAGLATVAIHSADDAQSMHVRAADDAHEIPGRGARRLSRYRGGDSRPRRRPAAMRCIPAMAFSARIPRSPRRCIEEGIVFVGPSPEALDLFGDKAQAKALAKRCGVPVIEGTGGPTSLDEAGFLCIARPRWRRDDQGHRRRRRTRHAHRRRRREARGGLCALPVRGEGGFRQRRRLCRAPDPQRPPHRGADHLRPPWRDQPFVGARMHASSAATRNSSRSRRARR